MTGRHRVRRQVFGLAVVTGALLGTLLTPEARAGSKERVPNVRRQTAPQLEPSAKIAVQPLGFEALSKLVAVDRTSVLSLNFLDSDHLLFTFRKGGLLKRLPDCPREDEDQEIHAVVLELPSGKVSAQSDWRMHDYGRYLWPLGDGRVLIRQRDKLSVTDASLELKPFLQSRSTLREVQVATDGKLVMVEIDRERHEDDEHSRLVADALRNGTSPPREDVQLAILRPDTRATVAVTSAHSPIHLPLINDGFVEALSGKKDEYLLNFRPFHGEAKIFGKVRSSCHPSEMVVAADTVTVLTCPPGGGDAESVALNMAGEQLWETNWDSHYVWPNYSYARQAARFAVGALRLSHAVTVTDPVNNEDVQAERVQVIDAASGKLQLAVEAIPMVGTGQNFALSPDGRKFAVLRSGALEIYDLPAPAQPASRQPAVKQVQQTPAPAANGVEPPKGSNAVLPAGGSPLVAPPASPDAASQASPSSGPTSANPSSASPNPTAPNPTAPSSQAPDAGKEPANPAISPAGSSVPK